MSDYPNVRKYLAERGLDGAAAENFVDMLRTIDAAQRQSSPNETRKACIILPPCSVAP